MAYRPMVSLEKYRGKRETPVHDDISTAAFKGDVVDVVWFIDNGTDVNEKTLDSFHDTPIVGACSSKHPNQSKIVEILLKQGADPHAWDSCGIPAVHYLVTSKSPSRFHSMRLITSYGFSFNVRDEIGRTVLDFALDNSAGTYAKVYETVRFLLFHVVELLRNDRPVLPPREIVVYRSCCYVFPKLAAAELSGFAPSELETASRWMGCTCCVPSLVEQKVEAAKCDALTPGVSWHDFLTADDAGISRMAQDHPELYFILNKPDNRKPYRYYGVEPQFDTFLYHFAVHQLANVRTREDFPLNYECLLHIASFLRLRDVVSLCVALNFCGRR